MCPVTVGIPRSLVVTDLNLFNGYIWYADGKKVEVHSSDVGATIQRCVGRAKHLFEALGLMGLYTSFLYLQCPP